MTSVTASTVKKRPTVAGIDLRKLLEWGGVGAGVILIAFGVAAIVLGFNGRLTVGSSLKKEKIVGTSDMTPAAIKSEAAKAIPNLKSLSVDWPTMNLVGKTIDSGSKARQFAMYMRIHALEAAGGKTYSQIPRFATADGKGTNDPAKAQSGQNGQPLDNPARGTWVTETALSTALNTSYMAEQLGNFGMVVGVALLLSGVGFTVLALGGALRGRDAREQ
jgi:hypothetical protein